MSEFSEVPRIFDCQGSALMGVLHATKARYGIGAVLLVGGPQYRVGAHRMFVEIARQLANDGIPTLRFDFRGMGDSEGDSPGFENLDEDIAAAVACLTQQCTDINEVALIGLCDGATGAALYDFRDPKVGRKVLLNPWVHTEAGEAKAYLSYYYPRRVLQKSFWVGLVQGKIGIVASLRDLFGKLYRVVVNRSNGDAQPTQQYRQRMLSQLQQFAGRVLIVLSEHDMTAEEFRNLAGNDNRWAAVLQQPQVQLLEIAGADHTLSDNRHLVEFVGQVTAWMSSDLT